MWPSLNRLLKLAQRLRAKAFTIAIRGDFATLGPRTTIEPPFRSSGESHIHIGARCYLGTGCWLQIVGDLSNDGQPGIHLGDNCSASGYLTITAARSVIIEDSVLIARYVYISDHSHSYTDITRPIQQQGIVDIRPVRICTGAWIGQGSVICPGVTIGRNCVIGANSVVKGNIPDYWIAAGAPARLVKQIGRAPQ